MGGYLFCITVGLALVHKNIPYFAIGARDTFAALFFLAGYWYKTSQYKIHDKIIILPVAIVLITLGKELYQATLLNFVWWKVLPYGITAKAGTLAVLYLSKKIVARDCRATKVLTYIGNNTLTILTWHMLSFKVVSLIIICIYGLPIERLAEFPVIEEYSKQGWFILYFLMGTLIPLGMTRIKNLK